MNTFGIH